MNDEELQNEIKKVVHAHGIDVPIMRTKVVGDRVELYLYGGTRVTFKAGRQPTTTSDQPPATSDQPPATDLKSLSRSQLLAIAKREKIPGRTKMNKSQLVKAIEPLLDEPEG